MLRTSIRVTAVLFVCASLFTHALFAEDAVAPPQSSIAAKRPLLDLVLTLNKIQEPEFDADAARAAFNELIVKARVALVGAKTPKEKVAALNKVLIADRKVEYVSNKYWRDSTLAAALLRGKGNCIATSVLFVLAGEALDLPVRLVLIPRHAFARWDDGVTKINIETTSEGREIADSDYFSRWGSVEPADIEKLGWGRSLDDKGVHSELLQLGADHRCGEGNMEGALELISQAEALTPNRSDLTLRRLELMTTIEGRRDEARAKIWELLRAGNPPPSVEVGALMFLASQSAGDGDHETEKKLLMHAFKQAPKTAQPSVLTQLAFCHRALRDYRAAVRYMELAIAMLPEEADMLYNLAILQKNDGRLRDALVTIRSARKLNPESWNIQVLEAGYMVLLGEREAGTRLFESIEPPRAEAEFFAVMMSWFYAVSGERAVFYEHFEKALDLSRTTYTLEWIDQDEDLDTYRNDERFKDLVKNHRARIMGKSKKAEKKSAAKELAPVSK